MDFLKRILAILMCFLRLFVVLLIAFFSAVNKILFDNMEIISASLIMRPQAPERNTLGFIDKLCLNNRELAKGGVIPEVDAFDNNDPFVPDDLLIEGEQIEDVPDEEDGNIEGEEEPHNNEDDDEGDGGSVG